MKRRGSTMPRAQSPEPRAQRGVPSMGASATALRVRGAAIRRRRSRRRGHRSGGHVGVLAGLAERCEAGSVARRRGTPSPLPHATPPRQASSHPFRVCRRRVPGSLLASGNLRCGDRGPPSAYRARSQIAPPSRARPRWLHSSADRGNPGLPDPPGRAPGSACAPDRPPTADRALSELLETRSMTSRWHPVLPAESDNWPPGV